MTEETDVVALLGTCGHDECQALAQVVTDPGLDPSTLGYEDVFSPLRWHSRDGLVLEVRTGRGDPLRYTYGAGDLIYHTDDNPRTWQTAIDPYDAFDVIQHEDVDLDVVLDENERPEGVDE